MQQVEIEVLDPSSGAVIATIAACDDSLIDKSVRNASAAFEQWRRTAPGERGVVLKAAASRLREHADELARLQTREGGKPLADSMGGVMAGISTIEQYAELGPLHRGKSLQGNWNAIDSMIHEPLGVVVVITPWNDPVAIALGLCAAALVTGNTVVLKPSEKTPLSAIRAVELMDLPNDVCQVVPGGGEAGRALVAHPDTDAVVHVGSMTTGREIAVGCAERGKKAVLELGGKDALIVDDDVDVTWAAEQAALGAFANAGQICTSVERIYVTREIAEPFTAALVEAAGNWQPGHPHDEDVRMGPMVDEGQRRTVADHVADAVSKGARIEVGGVVPEGEGSFYPPTVLSNVDDSMDVMVHETFGPVAPVCIVESFEDAIARANDSQYGLAATVLSNNQANIQTAIHELNVGTVKINAVFGGAPGGAAKPHRMSGSGYGYGPELLDELTTTKAVHVEPAPRGN